MEVWTGGLCYLLDEVWTGPLLTEFTTIFDLVFLESLTWLEDDDPAEVDVDILCECWGGVVVGFLTTKGLD